MAPITNRLWLDHLLNGQIIEEIHLDKAVITAIRPRQSQAPMSYPYRWLLFEGRETRPDIAISLEQSAFGTRCVTVETGKLRTNRGVVQINSYDAFRERAWTLLLEHRNLRWANAPPGKTGPDVRFTHQLRWRWLSTLGTYSLHTQDYPAAEMYFTAALRETLHFDPDGDYMLVTVINLASSLTVSPTSRAVRYRILELMEQEGQWERADTAIDQLLDLETDRPERQADLYLKRARITQHYRKKLEGALEAFETALKLDPDRHDAFEEMAQVLRQLERWELLARRYRGRLSHLGRGPGGSDDDERRRRLLLELGAVQRDQLGDAAAALESLEHALALAPNDDEIRQLVEELRSSET